MNITTTTLRPGLLVSLKTTIAGNVTYEKRDIGGPEVTDEGVVTKWQTERTIADQAEHEAATKARSKARAMVTGVCAASEFGLLCPNNKRDQLDIAIRDARRISESFNAVSSHSKISVYVIAGEIAADDVEAVKAISNELSGLLAEMREGVANVDVQRIRAAATRARSLGAMLAPEPAARVKAAIDAARSAARNAVKAGETAAQEIDQEALRIITNVRTAFLDIGDATDAPETMLPLEPFTAAPAPAVDLANDDDLPDWAKGITTAADVERQMAAVASPVEPVPYFEIEPGADEAFETAGYLAREDENAL